MRRAIISLAVVSVLLVVALSLLQVARGQGSDPNVLNTETQGENLREIYRLPDDNEPQQATIGFIENPSATCYQPDAARDECYLNWYYLSVNASPNYMITMTLSLNATGPLAHTQGFFQTSMHIPYNMLGNGFKVACGRPGAGGNPQLGNAYAYTVRARDSAGLSSANYGTSYCPPYRP